MSESEVLDVAAVMERYGFSDRRAARRVMDKSGGSFKVGSRLLVHAGALLAYEEGLVAARRGDGRGARPTTSPGVASAPSRRGRNVQPVREPLGPDWWRDAADRESVGASNGRKGGASDG